jgi:hypothetical protein
MAGLPAFPALVKRGLIKQTFTARRNVVADALV